MFVNFVCCDTSIFRIKKEKEDFYGIYLNNELISSKTTLKQAQKLCKLLRIAYNEGYKSAREIYY